MPPCQLPVYMCRGFAVYMHSHNILLCRFAGYPGHYETIFGLRQEQVRLFSAV